MVGRNNMQVMYSEGDASRENSGCFNITMFACYFETLINREQRIARVSSKSRSRQLLPSLDQSRSRQPLNFPVSIGLGIDNLEKIQSRRVSVSTT